MFTQQAAQQVSKILKEANNQKCSGIILDLRRNPGGVLESAIGMSGLFIKKNSLVVSTKNRQGKTISEYKTKTHPVLKSNVPIFILIDNFTASASEILAETLRFYSSQNDHTLMAFLVGSPTFGKGSVQEVIPLKDGYALKLTTMLYYTPNGTSPQTIGVKPDFHVNYKITPEKEIKFLKEYYGTESSLPNHITEKEVTTIHKNKTKKKKGSTKKEKTWEEKKLELVRKDPVIQTSINMITMLTMADPKQVSNRKQAIAFLQKHYVTDDDSQKIEKIT
jgi:carboxyl-terminal processing protease